MHRILLLIALVLPLAFLSVPADAQQQDTSALGRQAEGIPTGEAGQPAAPQEEGLTERQGIEGEDVTEPAAAGVERETTLEEEGAAMPTTASSLPLVALGGALLIGLGLGVRFIRDRS